MILHTPFGLIWTTPWPDAKELFLKFSKIRHSRNSQNSVWKPNFFLGTLYQKFFCFTLSLHWWYSIPPLVWFGHLLNPMKKPIFKIPFSRKSQNSVRKPNFSPRPALPIRLLYTLITRVILNTPLGLIWTTPWTDAKGLYLKFSKFRNSRNSQNSVWKSNFFLGTLYKNFFALHSHYTGDTPYRVWFDLDNFLTRWKSPIFKIPFSRNSKSSIWKPNLFPSQAKRKILFILHCHYNGDTQYRDWFHLGNSLTRWKATIFKFLKNSKFAKFAKFRMKIQLSPRQAIPTTFCFTLSLHW